MLGEEKCVRRGVLGCELKVVQRTEETREGTDVCTLETPYAYQGCICSGALEDDVARLRPL
jgi:hypothetical protein